MANQRILYTEEMVGDNHPTKTDTLNRFGMVEHTEDGTHGDITPATINCAGLITATGGQIAFPSTAVPSADANTLDDYEEGVFDAILTCGTSGTITLNSAVNKLGYTKIGREVFLHGQIEVDSVSSPVGLLNIGTLPFTAAAETEREARTSISLRCNTLEATATTAMQAYIKNAEAVINIEHFAAGVASTGTAADIKANSEFTIGGSYHI